MRFRLPEITNLEEIKVPPQKNNGGFVVVVIKATIQGKSPRLKFFPRIIRPAPFFETPQVSMLLGNRFALATITKALIRTKIRSFNFIIRVKRSTSQIAYTFSLYVEVTPHGYNFHNLIIFWCFSVRSLINEPPKFAKRKCFKADLLCGIQIINWCLDENSRCFPDNGESRLNKI